MTYTFESCFAARIEDFIAQKNALGFGYLESSRLLRDFDRFCMTHFPEENFLTEELCLAWATKKNTEGNNTFRNRMMPVREYAIYQNRNGEAAYVLPPDIARKDAPYAPYIYTEDDILTIWDVFDHLKPRGGFPVRQYVIPAMVKLMYCCGLRPAEARKLRVSDVDLEIGRLNIMESKKHRSRIVMMAEDVTQMLSDCSAIVASVMPEREPFFPNSEGGFYGKRGLEKTFRQVLKKAAITGTGRRSPRLYDFRHTFATHRLYCWMREGKDLNAMLPYLHGKGRKIRTVPLLSKTVQHCKQYLRKFHPTADYHSEAPLFFTVIHGTQQKMSPDTVSAFFIKYGSMAKLVCPEVPEHIHPHMMRHTRAMHLYQSGMPMVLLSQYLGHAQVETTMIYAHADTEMKRAAIQKADAVRKAKPAPDEIWADNEEMILKLSGLT